MNTPCLAVVFVRWCRTQGAASWRNRRPFRPVMIHHLSTFNNVIAVRARGRLGKMEELGKPSLAELLASSIIGSVLLPGLTLNLNQFHREREEFDSRVRKLSASVETTRAKAAAGASAQSIDLTRRLFDEIGVALEELSVAEEEMRHANDELLSSRDECESERRKYRELFDFCPDAYIVSDNEGVIRESNQAAATLFETQSEFLIGKPLLSFVLEQDRPNARRQLTALVERAGTTGRNPT